MIEKAEKFSSQVLEIHQGVQNITQLCIDNTVCAHYYTLFLLAPSHTNRSSCDSTKKSLFSINFHAAGMQIGFYSMLAELIWPPGSTALLLTP